MVENESHAQWLLERAERLKSQRPVDLILDSAELSRRPVFTHDSDANPVRSYLLPVQRLDATYEARLENRVFDLESRVRELGRVVAGLHEEVS